MSQHVFRCVGCNAIIPWDGKKSFAYTCACGATILRDDETGQHAYPASVLIQMLRGEQSPTPHLDDLVGNSDYTSPEKDALIAELRNRGFIWMDECVQCRLDGTWERHQRRLGYDKATMEVHNRAIAEGWDMEETIRRLKEVDKEFYGKPSSSYSSEGANG